MGLLKEGVEVHLRPALRKRNEGGDSRGEVGGKTAKGEARRAHHYDAFPTKTIEKT